MIERLGLIQLDSVNVFARAHYMPLFSRLGPYETAALDAAYGRKPRRLVEQWGHMACLVPPDVHQMVASLRRGWYQQPRAQAEITAVEEAHPGILDRAREAVAEHGPLTARRFEELHGTIPAKVPGMWSRSSGKAALEILWFGGDVVTAGRNAQFERIYDLPHRVLPQRDFDRDEARRHLALRALRHLGIGTGRCLADFYRLKTAPTEEALRRLEREGLAERVAVDGWRGTVWKDPAAVVPRRATGSALLSPFDPLVFERTRLLTLFGMHYRIGIYTPAAKRTHGYYSLPFLMGERIVGRYDLKADRAAGKLLVNGAFLEPPQGDDWPTPADIARSVSEHLEAAAIWLGLSAVVVPGDAPGDGVESLTFAVR